MNAQYSFQAPFISGIGRTYTRCPNSAIAPFSASRNVSPLPWAMSSGVTIPPVFTASIGTGAWLAMTFAIDCGWCQPMNEWRTDVCCPVRRAKRGASPARPSCVRVT